jgi:hypothetical protein
VVTKSEPNSGKLSLTNTELTPPEPITETLIYNLKESTFTITKLPEEDMYPEPSLWILNPVPWIPLELDLSVNSSDPTTSSSDKPEPETIGLKDITPKELN